MQPSNDSKLRNNCVEIDIILGGHEQSRLMSCSHDKWLIKSGSIFMHFSKIIVDFDRRNGNGRPEISHESIDVTHRYDDDPKLKIKLKEYTSNQFKLV